MHAARLAGATWDQIGTATGTTAEAARGAYIEAVERQERYGFTDTTSYREVTWRVAVHGRGQ